MAESSAYSNIVLLEVGGSSADTDVACSTVDILALENQAAGTPYAASSVLQNAFVKHVDGFQWMVRKNTQDNALRWDNVRHFFLAFI